MSNDYKEGKIEKPKATTKTSPKRISVKVIETRGESSLVEWINADKIRCRAYVAADLVYDDKVLWSTLANPLPVGPDPMNLDLHTFTVQLRLRNVWTKADFLKKRNSVIRSLFEAMED